MYVYVIRSIAYNKEIYVGVAKEVLARLEQHNRGDSFHTAKYRPWELENVVWFRDAEKAFSFERWLKSGSGRAFRNRHF